ncbi:hypothetical protein [Bradyrhizobium sp. sGM-13]|uniref:hypothetical protein n=1 Tax=Bradyrhizobium sp. sGM-13 TaxID=2831781 RepID=UPI001BCA9FED|nr:hypothetical protein [Bradyrhizobium sp. sGM-13]
MSYQATVFNVMIASPGDVAAERKLARDIIHEWNTMHSESRATALMPIGWETHSHPSMEERPQGVLNGQILEGADLLVAIFWTRIGTPTGVAVSGSVEEIEEHVKAGKPAMIYFSSAPVRPDSVDEAQYKALKEFREQLKTRGLFETYDSTDGFAEKFRRQLATKINNDLFFHVEGAGAGREALINEVLSEAAQTIPGMSDEAKTLLVEGSLDRNGQILHVKFISGDVIQVNGKKFTGEDARTKATWLGALRELASLGLL